MLWYLLYHCSLVSPLTAQTRNPFSISFYLVALLFLIFDLEIALVYPVAVSLNAVGNYGFWIAMAFLALLTVGFVFEYGKKALSFTDHRSAITRPDITSPHTAWAMILFVPSDWFTSYSATYLADNTILLALIGCVWLSTISAVRCWITYGLRMVYLIVANNSLLTKWICFSDQLVGALYSYPRTYLLLCVLLVPCYAQLPSWVLATLTVVTMISMALSYSFYEYRSDQQYTSLEKSDMDFALFLFIVEAALALIYGVNHGVALDMLNSFTSTVIVAITYPLFLRAVLGAMHYAKYHTTAYPWADYGTWTLGSINNIGSSFNNPTVYTRHIYNHLSGAVSTGLTLVRGYSTSAFRPLVQAVTPQTNWWNLLKVETPQYTGPTSAMTALVPWVGHVTWAVVTGPRTVRSQIAEIMQMVHEVEVSQFTSNRHLLVHRFLELNIPMHPSFMNLILRPIAGSSAINHELVSLLENLEGHTFAFPIPVDDYEELRVLIGRRNLRSGQGGVGVYHIYETVPPYRNLVGQSISLRERLNSYVKDVTAALEAGTPDKLTLKGKGAQWMYEVGLDNLQVTLYVLPNRGVGLYPCLTPTDYALAMELFYMVKFRPSVNQSLVPGSTYPGNNESRILLSESMGTEVHVYLGNHRIYNIRSQQRLSGIMTGNPSTLGQLKNRKNTTAIGGVLYPTAYWRGLTFAWTLLPGYTDNLMSEDTFAKMCKDLRARDVRNPDNRQGPSQTTQLLVLTIHNQHVDSVNGLAPARAVAGINTRTALDGLVYDPSGSSDFRHATTELTIFVVNNVEYAVAVHPGNQTAVDELIASIMSNLSSAERRVFRVRKGPSTAVPVRVTCTPTGKVKYYKTMSSALNSYKTDFPGYHLSKHQLDKARAEALRTGETVYTLTDFKLEIISVEQYTASLS